MRTTMIPDIQQTARKACKREHITLNMKVCGQSDQLATQWACSTLAKIILLAFRSRTLSMEIIYYMLWYVYERRGERNSSRGMRKRIEKQIAGQHEEQTTRKERLMWWVYQIKCNPISLAEQESTISFPETVHFRSALTERSVESEAKLGIISRACNLFGQHEVVWCSQKMVLTKTEPDATIILYSWTVLPNSVWDEIKSTAKKHSLQKTHWGSFSRKT